MKISVISLSLDDHDEFFETLGSVQAALNSALSSGLRLQVQVVAVVPESHDEISELLEAHPEEFAGLPLCVEVVHDQGIGIAAAFNAGLENADGELIAFLNAGDRWFEHTLVSVHHAREEAPRAILHSRITYEATGSRRYEVTPDPARLHQRMTVFHPTMFVPKEVFERVGGFDISFRLAMDSQWCHRSLVQSQEYYEARDSLAIMRLGGRSDQQYALALAEFRRSVVETGLASPLEADWHYWRIRCAKVATHWLPLRNLISRFRSLEA